MPKIDLSALPASEATTYPAPYAGAMRGRWVRRLTAAAGLSDFGAAHVTLSPGARTSQRHWHEGEDELVVVLAGEALLIDDAGRTPMRAGDIAVFPKGEANGHCLVNESDGDCVLLAIGRSLSSPCHYPDIDLFLGSDGRYRRKDGSSF